MQYYVDVCTERSVVCVYEILHAFEQLEAVEDAPNAAAGGHHHHQYHLHDVCLDLSPTTSTFARMEGSPLLLPAAGTPLAPQDKLLLSATDLECLVEALRRSNNSGSATQLKRVLSRVIFCGADEGTLRPQTLLHLLTEWQRHVSASTASRNPVLLLGLRGCHIDEAIMSTIRSSFGANGGAKRLALDISCNSVQQLPRSQRADYVHDIRELWEDHGMRHLSLAYSGLNLTEVLQSVEEGLNFIQNALRSLETLSLRGNNCLFGDGFPWVRRVAESLLSQPAPRINIRVLDVSRMELGDEAAEALCWLLEDPNCTIEVLAARRNNFTFVGLTHFAEAVVKNTSLVELYIGDQHPRSVPARLTPSLYSANGAQGGSAKQPTPLAGHELHTSSITESACGSAATSLLVAIGGNPRLRVVDMTGLQLEEWEGGEKGRPSSFGGVPYMVISALSDVLLNSGNLTTVYLTHPTRVQTPMRREMRRSANSAAPFSPAPQTRLFASPAGKDPVMPSSSANNTTSSAPLVQPPMRFTSRSGGPAHGSDQPHRLHTVVFGEYINAINSQRSEKGLRPVTVPDGLRDDVLFSLEWLVRPSQGHQWGPSSDHAGIAPSISQHAPVAQAAAVSPRRKRVVSPAPAQRGGAEGILPKQAATIAAALTVNQVQRTVSPVSSIAASQQSTAVPSVYSGLLPAAGVHFPSHIFAVESVPRSAEAMAAAAAAAVPPSSAFLTSNGPNSATDAVMNPHNPNEAIVLLRQEKAQSRMYVQEALRFVRHFSRFWLLALEEHTASLTSAYVASVNAAALDAAREAAALVAQQKASLRQQEKLLQTEVALLTAQQKELRDRQIDLETEKRIFEAREISDSAFTKALQQKLNESEEENSRRLSEEKRLQQELLLLLDQQRLLQEQRTEMNGALSAQLAIDRDKQESLNILETQLAEAHAEIQYLRSISQFSTNHSSAPTPRGSTAALANAHGDDEIATHDLYAPHTAMDVDDHTETTPTPTQKSEHHKKNTADGDSHAAGTTSGRSLSDMPTPQTSAPVPMAHTGTPSRQDEKHDTFYHDDRSHGDDSRQQSPHLTRMTPPAGASAPAEGGASAARPQSVPPLSSISFDEVCSAYPRFASAMGALPEHEVDGVRQLWVQAQRNDESSANTGVGLSHQKLALAAFISQCKEQGLLEPATPHHAQSVLSYVTTARVEPLSTGRTRVKRSSTVSRPESPSETTTPGVALGADAEHLDGTMTPQQTSTPRGATTAAPAVAEQLATSVPRVPFLKFGALPPQQSAAGTTGDAATANSTPRSSRTPNPSTVAPRVDSSALRKKTQLVRACDEELKSAQQIVEQRRHQRRSHNSSHHHHNDNDRDLRSESPQFEVEEDDGGRRSNRDEASQPFGRVMTMHYHHQHHHQQPAREASAALATDVSRTSVAFETDSENSDDSSQDSVQFEIEESIRSVSNKSYEEGSIVNSPLAVRVRPKAPITQGALRVKREFVSKNVMQHSLENLTTIYPKLSSALRSLPRIELEAFQHSWRQRFRPGQQQRYAELLLVMTNCAINGLFDV